MGQRLETLTKGPAGWHTKFYRNSYREIFSRKREVIELACSPSASGKPSREATGTGRRGYRLARVHEAGCQMAVLDFSACASKKRLSIGPWSNRPRRMMRPQTHA